MDGKNAAAAVAAADEVRRLFECKGSIDIERTKEERGFSFFALRFEDPSATVRRGVVSVLERVEGYEVCGSFFSARPNDAENEFGGAQGGWGPATSSSPGVFGIWLPTVRDGTQVQLVDPAKQVVDDRVLSGIAMFTWYGPFAVTAAVLRVISSDGALLSENRLFETSGD